MTYAGKKAVVTGGTHGIGLAVVKALLDGGAEVVLTGRNERNIEAARTELAGRAAHVVRSDAASLADITALGDLVERTLGAVDLVFVNHGYAETGPLASVTEAAYDRMLDINAKGAFFTAQRLAPLIAPGGALVFTGAVLVGMGWPDSSVATMAKAAVHALAQSLAAELLPRGIRVNTVSPGFTLTPTMGFATMTAAEQAANLDAGNAVTPMGRHGSAEEIAAAVLFLAFTATFSTGIVLAADGGLGHVEKT
ncbi:MULTISPECIES: SDR family oxidoreductase [unclassified Crossiella]|uniref:SDR family oxidoreductase n=1 Tax=unclassified Crossiella TaxID=2620835 RepID=UPI001FFECCDC|nr:MULTISPECIES: SDR family oxidoreductase [unclassified Crossiella]MCK2245176.1 SDR family oxidoreductase [Crossiella sp. S99.2]MCK2258829.1 SDR family oxidoreductase [Crossiella sp. S99.1]